MSLSSCLTALLADFPSATDIHITEGEAVRVRAGGMLSVWDGAEAAGLLAGVLGEEARAAIGQVGAYDGAVSVGEVRCRIHGYRSMGRLSAAVRILPALSHLPPDPDGPWMDDVTHRHAGLVLVTGPTGSGKSTTLAHLVCRLSAHPLHIVTIEDPAEYVFPSRAALIHQREVGRDTEDFAAGVREALREDPDVLVIGELRDAPTMAAALTAAETGHLVLSTMHTKTAAGAVSRLVHGFPSEKESEIRAALSQALLSIAAQTLYRKDGRTHLLREILVNTPPIAHLIREGKEAQLASYMETGTRHMRTMKQAVSRVAASEHWTYDERERALQAWE